MLIVPHNLKNYKQLAIKVYKYSCFILDEMCVSVYTGKVDGGMAQLVRAFGSHPRGRGFESPCLHHLGNGLVKPFLLFLA